MSSWKEIFPIIENYSGSKTDVIPNKFLDISAQRIEKNVLENTNWKIRF